ncbi:hypothetical protein [Thomasclavelia cocleata]|uniref:hypothetical protein n=1 Tax=Thomasclavelia cocleata TaxID=69824 RepID=UPI00243213AD|nr:hypothetical protein [Thomasclavelia cocleata]
MKLQERLEKLEKVKKEYYETINNLPELQGSEKQIAWANDLRNKYVVAVNEYIINDFDKRRLTRIIVVIVAINCMLKNIDAKFYINNKDECRYCPDDLAYTFVGLKIKRPAEYDLSMDYLVDLVRNGTSIEDIKKMLSEK